MTNYGYIYVIENDLNPKLYIGRTLDLNKRERVHFSEHSRTWAIKSAIEKYGASHFDFVLLEACASEEELNAKEKYWIGTLNTLAPRGYNLKTGGKSGRPVKSIREKMSLAHKGVALSDEHKSAIGLALQGHETSEETRQKISLSHLGLTHSDASRKKMSQSHRGKKISLEVRLKIGASQKGKSKGPKSDDHRLKISAALKGKFFSEEHKRKISEALRGNRNAAK